MRDRFSSASEYLEALEANQRAELYAEYVNALQRLEREDAWDPAGSDVGSTCFTAYATSSNAFKPSSGLETSRLVIQTRPTALEVDDGFLLNLVRVRSEDPPFSAVVVVLKAEETSGGQVTEMFVHPKLPSELLAASRSDSAGRRRPPELTIQNLLFIGSAWYELQALRKLQATTSGQVHPLLEAAADPTKIASTQGVYLSTTVQPSRKCNASQVSAINGLSTCIETIHGPPGTGKSTTLAKILERLPSDTDAAGGRSGRSQHREQKRVLVTCTRNAAVDSIAQKLESARVRFLVVANEKRVGPTAARATLSCRTTADKRVIKAQKKLDAAKRAADNAQSALKSADRHLQALCGDTAAAAGPSSHPKHGSSSSRASKQRRLMEILTEDFGRKLSVQDQAPSRARPAAGELAKALVEAKEAVRAKEEEHTTALAAAARADSVHAATVAAVELELVQRCRVILCTVASCYRAIRSLGDVLAREGRVDSNCSNDEVDFSDSQDLLNVRTVIVDEAGCTPESSNGILIGLKPDNLILIGDPFQLQPFTAISNRVGDPKRHGPSFMERVLRVRKWTGVHQLTVQYRMHPAICAVISARFYQGKQHGKVRALTTGDITAQERTRRHAMAWIESVARAGRRGTSCGESKKGTSFINVGEAEQVLQVLEMERRLRKDSTILILSPYKPQVKLIRRMLADPRRGAPSGGTAPMVETVDAVQGQEADLVIISLVRNNDERKIGFLRTPNRANVMISRAREQAVIVGATRTFSADSMWSSIRASSTTPHLSELCH